MGIYDRGYYDGESWKGDGGNQGGGVGAGFGGFKQTMIATLIMINVAIFVLDMFSPKVTYQQPGLDSNGDVTTVEVKSDQQKIARFLALKHGLENRGSSGPLDNPLNSWQLVTHGFAHASIGQPYGIMHVAFNMLTLFFLGIPVERKLGRYEFLKFYMLALIFAGLVWLLAMYLTNSPRTAVGASGAVSAVVILFVFHFPKETLMLMGVIPMKAWVLGVIFVGMDLLRSFNPESPIAWQAHLGGALFAFLYYYFRWNFSWLKFGWLTKLSNRMKGKPNLKVHSPEEPDPELAKQADIILDKVHRLGEESLTRKERSVLKRFSKTVRKKRDS